MALAGKDFKVQVSPDGTTWTEIAVASDASPSITAELLDVTHFGDDAIRRIQGVVDTGLELEFFTDETPNQAIRDIDDAALDVTSLEVEFSPDGNAAAGPTDVYAFTALVEDYEFTAGVGDAQNSSLTLNNSDGSTVTTTGTFSS